MKIDVVGLIFMLTIPMLMYTGLRFRFLVRKGHPPPWPLDLAVAALVGFLVALAFFYLQPPTSA